MPKKTGVTWPVSVSAFAVCLKVDLAVQVTSPNGVLNISNISYQTPEPGTLVMLGSGLLAPLPRHLKSINITDKSRPKILRY
jgi:hypothetical protein